MSQMCLRTVRVTVARGEFLTNVFVIKSVNMLTSVVAIVLTGPANFN